MLGGGCRSAFAEKLRLTLPPIEQHREAHPDGD
jgi:hypothetical protein